MSAQTSMGKCSLCGEVVSRTAMTRHLKGCGPKTGKASPGKCFHVFVEGRYAKGYWMHLAVPVDAPLSSLDNFLRQIWLECCGHLSAFTIEGRRYSCQPTRELDEKSMRVAVNRVFAVGLKFLHEYDYGSTTELALKVVGERDHGAPRGAVQLLARNEAPQVPCDKCKAKPATEICTECAWSGDGWFCEECMAAHKCGRDMALPVVNSPRVGVCGYTG